MPIRITGLNSGLDTESIISALVSSYSYKTDKYKKAQTKLSWKQDAWKSLNTKIYSLYNSLGNLRFSSAYNMKSCTVSDSTKVSVTAGGNAINGSYSVQVTELAKSGYLTGAKLQEGTTASTKLSKLGYTGYGTISLKVGSETTDINVTKDTTIQEVVDQLREAGVNASFDEANGRFFVSAKKTGAANDFTLTGADESGTAALTMLGLNTDATVNYKELAAYSSLTEDEIKEIVGAKKEKANYQDAITYLNAQKSLNEIKASYTDADADEKFALLEKLTLEGDLTGKYVDADGNVYTKNDNGNYEINRKNPDGTEVTEELTEEQIKEEFGFAAASETYNELLVDYKFAAEVDDGEIVIDHNALAEFRQNVTSVAEITKKADTDVQLSDLLDEADEIIAGTATDIPSNVSGMVYFDAKMRAGIQASDEILAKYKNTEKLTGDMTDEDIAKFMADAAYAKDVVNGVVTPDYVEGATRVKGSDAVIYVNGAKYTGDSNSFSINGMTITATGITGEYSPYDLNAVTVGVNTDTQGIYDKVKDFLTQYNAIINEMTSLYNADSAKGYEPLTDEEKDAMSDTEVEKWEEKVKSALLRRDDTLSGIISTMNNAMSKGVDVNGKKYYLSDFGIQTLGFLNAAKNEHNAYHIDGDEDDVNTSGKTDKLMAAIAEDPDTVIEFMKGLSKNLYESIDAKMKSTTLSSSYTVYNDKEMASEYSDYTTTITKWMERLEQQEEYYYNKFAQMETALSKLNSQTSSLSGLLGM